MRVRRFGQDERGGAAIEYALLAPILIFLLFATIEVGLVGMMSAGLDNGVTQAARMIRTGQDDGPVDNAGFEGLVCTSLGGDTAECRSRLQVSVRRYATFAQAVAAAQSPPDGAFDKGEAGDIIMVRAAYRWPMITPTLGVLGEPRPAPFEVTLDARAAFKNEPYK